PAERTAAQVLASPPRGDPWVLRTLRDAAAAASVRGAPDVAERFLRRALEEKQGDDERIELLRELGRATTATKGPEGLAPLREALDLADTPVLRAEVALELARGLFSLGFFGEGAE